VNIKKIKVNLNEDFTELKPCPFCGSKNIELSAEEYYDKDVFYIVSCNNCGAKIEGSGRNKEAAEAWNTRCE
jgi:Lar family restriction alleviation protein